MTVGITLTKVRPRHEVGQKVRRTGLGHGNPIVGGYLKIVFQATPKFHTVSSDCRADLRRRYWRSPDRSLYVRAVQILEWTGRINAGAKPSGPGGKITGIERA